MQVCAVASLIIEFLHHAVRKLRHFLAGVCVNFIHFLLVSFYMLIAQLLIDYLLVFAVCDQVSSVVFSLRFILSLLGCFILKNFVWFRVQELPAWDRFEYTASEKDFNWHFH